jgi:hypothetical protein
VGFSSPSGETTVTAGRPATIQIGVAAAGDQATTVHWQAAPGPSGLTVTPSSGTLTLTPVGCNPSAPAMQTLSVTVPSTASGSTSLRVNLSSSGRVTLPPVVLDLQVRQ